MSEPRILTPEEIDACAQYSGSALIAFGTRQVFGNLIATVRAAWSERDAALAECDRLRAEARMMRAVVEAARYALNPKHGKSRLVAALAVLDEWEQRQREEAKG